MNISCFLYILKDKRNTVYYKTFKFCKIRKVAIEKGKLFLKITTASFSTYVKNNDDCLTDNGQKSRFEYDLDRMEKVRLVKVR